MPKINVYVPQDLADEIHKSKISVSPVCQAALRKAVGGNENLTEKAKRTARLIQADGYASFSSRDFPASYVFAVKKQLGSGTYVSFYHNDKTVILTRDFIDRILDGGLHA
jgi:post-segregation antitoxin (ccd killing protein)